MVLLEEKGTLKQDGSLVGRGGCQETVAECDCTESRTDATRHIMALQRQRKRTPGQSALFSLHFFFYFTHGGKIKGRVYS